jgi:hypothetical protein
LRLLEVLRSLLAFINVAPLAGIFVFLGHEFFLC